LAVDDHQPSAGTQHADPLVDRELGMGEGPEQVAADHEIEAPAREPELLGVALVEPDRGRARRRLAPRLGDHRGPEVDAGHAMPAREELEAEEPGAAADVERGERTAAGEHAVQDAV